MPHAAGPVSRALVLGTAAAALTALGWVAARARLEPPDVDAARRPILLAADRVAVAPFGVAAGDTTLAPLGIVAADWITQGLAHAGVARVVPTPAALATTLARAAVTDSTSFAEETGAGLVVEGTIHSRGDSLRLAAWLVDARRRDTIALPPVEVPRALALDGIEAVRQRVTAGLGPLLDSRLTTLASTSQAPPAPEAYREYALGLERNALGDWRAALAHFARAAAEDSTFAAPLLQAAVTSDDAGDVRVRDSLLDALAPRQDRLGPVDAALYDVLAASRRGDRASAGAAAARAATLAPGTSAEVRFAREAIHLNRPHDALRVLDALDPTRGDLRTFLPYWLARGNALHMLGEYKQELDAARHALALDSAAPDARSLELRALAALGRCDRLGARLDADSAAWSPDMLRRLAAECAAHGDSGWGAALAERGLQLAREAARRRPRSASAMAVVEALAATRNWREARSLADSLLFMEHYDVDLRGRRGVIAVRLGDSTAAREADAWLALPRPGGVPGRAELWRARIASARGDTLAAMTQLDLAARDGLPFDEPLHADPDLLPTRATASFRAWLAPKD